MRDLINLRLDSFSFRSSSSRPRYAHGSDIKNENNKPARFLELNYL